MLFLLSSCQDNPPPVEILAACGNGLIEADEQCDDGEANSDTLADACRASCRLPSCGDGVTDSEEACDDGNAWGGDGCAPTCAAQSGALESEPNDSWDAGQALAESTVDAALTSGDIDCFTVEVAECRTIAAGQTAGCTADLVLALHDPSGTQVAASAVDTEGCAQLDPIEEPGARFATEGTWAVCASALLGGEVPSYSLYIESGDSSDYELSLADSEDFDGDGLIELFAIAYSFGADP